MQLVVLLQLLLYNLYNSELSPRSGETFWDPTSPTPFHSRDNRPLLDYDLQLMSPSRDLVSTVKPQCNYLAKHRAERWSATAFDAERHNTRPRCESRPIRLTIAENVGDLIKVPSLR